FSVNGVSLSPVPLDVSSRSLSSRFRLLTAGRLIPLKGFDLAVRAFGVFLDRLNRGGQEKQAELIIIGDGPERSRLMELIHELGLENHVHMVKWMAREDLFKEMAECDAFVFPSLRDGGGLVVVEAMSAGKPVVCFNLAGPGLHVTDECGIRVAAHSPEQAIEDLASAFQRLCSSDGLRLAMGQASRKRAEDVYDWDRVAERIRDIYRDALGPQLDPVEAVVSRRTEELAEKPPLILDDAETRAKEFDAADA
ncbi:MAG TPA: glycosyltransferase, partial [Terriglobia bacterium]|nr:glycosyltransferase [Terriglobia bacterium]